MTTDPQPIEMPEGYDWYWPSHLNDDEWVVWGRGPKDDAARPPSRYDDTYGPILARRKPWIPKPGDRVVRSDDGWAGTVEGVLQEWCWIQYDRLGRPTTVLAADLSPLPEGN